MDRCRAGQEPCLNFILAALIASRIFVQINLPHES